MFLINKIIPIYFFIALFVGFLLTYSFTPSPEIVYKYPTPDNAKELTFVDKVKNCYKYNTTKVACPKKKEDIHTIPIQKTKDNK